MTTFLESTWESTRAGCAKGSGVAKAVKALNKLWPSDLATVGSSGPSILLALTKLDSALNVAKTKCTNPPEKENPKKVLATLHLISEWKQKILTYKHDVTEAVKNNAKKIELDLKSDLLDHEKHQKDFKKLDEYITAEYTDAVGLKINDCAKNLDLIPSLLKKLDFENAYMLYGKVFKAADFCRMELTPVKLKQKFEDGCRFFKISAAEHKSTEFQPKNWNAWKGELEKLSTLLKKRETEIDEAEEKHVPDDGSNAEGSEQYKKGLQTVIKQYRSVEGLTSEAVKVGQIILNKTNELHEFSNHVTETTKPKLQHMLKDLVTKQHEISTKVEKEVEKIRNTKGEYNQNKNKFKIVTSDQSKYLGPIQRKILAKNMIFTDRAKEVVHLLGEVAVALKTQVSNSNSNQEISSNQDIN